MIGFSDWEVFVFVPIIMFVLCMGFRGGIAKSLRSALYMEEVCGLEHRKNNMAWCFDGVPEENSIRGEIDGVAVEFPAMDLVKTQPVNLLGKKVFSRFGAEFPIRFDFLDTMSGGNLSLQVHPLTEYIHDNFGMSYTQDESYYILDGCGKTEG